MVPVRSEAYHPPRVEFIDYYRQKVVSLSQIRLFGNSFVFVAKAVDVFTPNTHLVW